MFLPQRRITGMTHYSEEPAKVRADFFKPDTGKWYMTEALDMSGHFDDISANDAVRNALADTPRGNALDRWVIVVLAPYHKNAHPIMLTPGKASYEPWPTEYKKIYGPGDEPGAGQ